MGELIVAYGPAMSGKTTAARAWAEESDSARVIYEIGGTPRPHEIDLIAYELSNGKDVWVNLLTANNDETPFVNFGPDIQVIYKRFVHYPGRQHTSKEKLRYYVGAR